MRVGAFRRAGPWLVAVGVLVGLVKATGAQDKYSNLANAVMWSLRVHDGSHRVVVKLGPTVLSIPDNYIFTPPHQDASPKGGPAHADRVSFDILVSINGFKPRSKDNIADFPEPGIGNKLRIGILYNYGDMNSWKQQEAAADQYHLSKHELHFRKEIGMHYYVSPYEGEVLFDDPPEARKGRIICGGPLPEEFPRDKHELGCARQVDVGNNVSVSWAYNRNYLPQRAAVERMVIDGLNQFRVSGPPLQIIE